MYKKGIKGIENGVLQQIFGGSNKITRCLGISIYNGVFFGVEREKGYVNMRQKKTD